MRRPAGRSQPSYAQREAICQAGLPPGNGGLQRALRNPLQADCAQGPAAELRQSVLLACSVCSNACCVAHRGAETEQNHNGALTLALPLLLSVLAVPDERQDRKGVW